LRTLFFAAIACGLLSSWLVDQQWIAAGLLLLWLVRVVCLRDRTCLIVTTILTVSMAGWLGWQNRQFQRVTQLLPREAALTLMVQPDMITVRGGQYQLIATSTSGRLLVRGELPSATAKHRLAQINRRTQWRVQGTLSPVPPPTNPGQFNAPAYYRSQGVYQQLTVESVRSVGVAPRTGFFGWQDRLHQWRSQFAQICQRLPPMIQLYATSLLIGLRPTNFQTTMGSVQQLGLLHLFSLSGMHVILFANLLKWLLVRVHLSRQAADYWVLGLLPLYLVLGGGADSLQRAVITAGLPIIWQRLTRQSSSALSGWSMALLIGIVHNPLVLSQLGGQLSYGLALLLILMPNSSTWQLAVRVQLISLPVLLVATAQWHVLSLAVNLVMAPLFSWVLLPVTMLGASAGLAVPELAQWCDWILTCFQNWLDWVSTWPGLLTIGQPSAPWAWLLGLLSLWLLRTPTKRWLRWLVVTYGCLVLSIRYPLCGAVQFIDIGQGDSILIRQPFNRTVSLIDTGGRLQIPRPAWQEDGLKPKPRVATITVNYLHRLGITRIDTVYLSHKDVDHIGDLGELLRLIPVKRIIVPAGMAHLPKFQRLLTTVKVKPPVIEVLVGQQFADGLTAIHPFQPGRAENADSLVLTGVFGGQRFMFTGDLDRAGERKIMERYPQLRIDVLKLGHHGSKTASDPQVLRHLGVRYGILSVGRHNRYGHPNQETLDTLASQKIMTYSTALQGMVTYRFGGRLPSVWQTFLKEGNSYQRTAGVKGDSRG